MSDNRAFEWLDDATVERLLRGDHDDPRADALTLLLSAAASPAVVDAQREEMAVAAFRAAREEGRKEPPGRRRGIIDDWRRRGGALRTGRSVRALTGALVATAAIGGVAVAAATGVLSGALGPVGGTPAGHAATAESATPQATTWSGQEDESPAGGSTQGLPTPTESTAHTDGDRPEALCRAWAVAVRRNQAMDARSYERLTSDAGGRNKVLSYCAGQLGWSGKNMPSSEASEASGKQGGDGGGKGEKGGDGDGDSGGGKGEKGDDSSDGKGHGDGGTSGPGDGHNGSVKHERHATYP